MRPTYSGRESSLAAFKSGHCPFQNPPLVGSGRSSSLSGPRTGGNSASGSLMHETTQARPLMGG